VEGLLLAALHASGPAAAFSSLAFARAAGYGSLATAARDAAAADVAGGLVSDPAGLASLTEADLASVLTVPGTACPPRPTAPPRPAFDAVSAWYEADPVRRAPAVAGLLETAVRLRRLRPHQLEEIAEAPATNATADATAEFARAYLDVGYMGMCEFEVEEEAGVGAGVEAAGEEEEGANPAAGGGEGAALTAAPVLGDAVLRGVLLGAGMTPPRRRQRVGGEARVVEAQAGGGLRRELW